jgi:hypothetical protein
MRFTGPQKPVRMFDMNDNAKPASTGTSETAGSARRITPLDAQQSERVGTAYTVRSRWYGHNDGRLLPDLARHLDEGWTCMGMESSQYAVTVFWSRPNASGEVREV